MAWTTPRTWVAGEVVTAAIMNTHLRDNFNSFGAAWSTSWTPTWTASTTNPTLGNGTISGRYAEAGKTIFVYFSLVFGSTTTSGAGLWRFSYPVAPRAYQIINTGFPGWFYGEDAGAVGYYLLPMHMTASTWSCVPTDGTNHARLTNQLQPAVPFTWAVGDFLENPAPDQRPPKPGKKKDARCKPCRKALARWSKENHEWW